ncbi:hypothetical protein DPEC_G00117610 [Dallia pectoralis]|uniref:Uncharacterized protein n=1 Tax=Dallia pectoralis TaxID=75939 RepID=A0ACC2GVM4_DALPE|nr:hypothetical protein DPEC_G00117610 [Dallia pectoralis]
MWEEMWEVALRAAPVLLAPCDKPHTGSRCSFVFLLVIRTHRGGTTLPTLHPPLCSGITVWHKWLEPKLFTLLLVPKVIRQKRTGGGEMWEDARRDESPELPSLSLCRASKGIER